MSKFQFFCMPNTDRKKFTYLKMDSDSFMVEKNQLLKLGFEVEDDVIFADTADEAIDKFNSNYVYALQEYADSSVGGGLGTFIIESYKDIIRRFKS
ncbi:hypothetical protein [Photobacterium kishitanii]|uniref:Uncharacterized protein n=1 Tax=Photobacterium kishitanii TaxID=318456 RepID=A0A0B7JDI8_9GAMM|nr:hypothetical protein [Photobacterium kishitanii]PSU91729.1 hypothetical protein C0W42_03460 [Photobacterium kishitanii]PSU92962.1 hypothetical protein C0W35_13110 [Photobacterium kishitanii]PSU95906.1 hypothetical protein C9J27_17390 [Photobacterium kishitanii]CEO41260.1 conserved hypothetical protein [Photobacterium kishitanii]